MKPSVIDYSVPMPRPVLRRVVTAIVVAAAVALPAAWLGFSLFMIGRNMFQPIPAGATVRVLQGGVLAVTRTDAAGSVFTKIIEPMKTAMSPALLAPILILFARRPLRERRNSHVLLFTRQMCELGFRV